MKRLLNVVKNRIQNFKENLKKDCIDIYTAQASFFLILSVFPFILLFFNILGTTSFTEESFVSVVNRYVPSFVCPLLTEIINELYAHSFGTVISISAIVAIWSASKGVLAVMRGLYKIYNINQEPKYIILRFISMGYTVLMLISLFITIILLVFGNHLFHLALSLIPALESLSYLSVILRYITTFIFLSIFFAIIFRIANLKYTTFKKIIPGALLSALGWIAFSFGFSVYIDNFSNMSYMYGSMTAIIILMLWFYFCIYILFIGAEINKSLHPEISVPDKN